MTRPTHAGVGDVLHRAFAPRTIVLDSPAGGSTQGRGARLSCWWDGPWGVQLRMVERPEEGGALLLGLAPVGPEVQGVALLQVQCAGRGNRWLYSLRWQGQPVGPRDLALLALHRAYPDVTWYAPDGAQKCSAVLRLHWGSTLEELEDDDFGGWLDGEAVLPRIRRTHDALPAGWSFGGALDLGDGVSVRRLLVP